MAMLLTKVGLLRAVLHRVKLDLSKLNLLPSTSPLHSKNVNLYDLPLYVQYIMGLEANSFNMELSRHIFFLGGGVKEFRLAFAVVP